MHAKSVRVMGTQSLSQCRRNSVLRCSARDLDCATQCHAQRGEARANIHSRSLAPPQKKKTKKELENVTAPSLARTHQLGFGVVRCVRVECDRGADRRAV